MFKELLIFILGLILLSVAYLSTADAAVRYNQYTGYWEGNICMTPWGWGYVQWQPIGTYCTIYTPKGPVIGMIINDPR